jgi:hypothetical protein
MQGRGLDGNESAGRRSVSCKWVFNLKEDAGGRMVKYKASLVAEGFSPVSGVDFETLLLQSAEWTSHRILPATAVTEDLEVRQADVEGAYVKDMSYSMVGSFLGVG